MTSERAIEILEGEQPYFKSRAALTEEESKDAFSMALTLLKGWDCWNVPCPRCGTGEWVIYDSEEDFEGVGYEGDGIVSFLHCQKCGCEMEFALPEKNPYEEISTQDGERETE